MMRMMRIMAMLTDNLGSGGMELLGIGGCIWYFGFGPRVEHRWKLIVCILRCRINVDNLASGVFC